MKPILQSIRYRYFDKFIYIHINKTGGSSVERALNLPHEHKTALEKIAEMGWNQWNKRFVFTVIRNPWDKVVSHYHYRVQTNQTNLGIRPIDFKEWIKLSYGENDPRYYDKPKMFMPQLDWISDKNGEILVDIIYRFENLREDFEKICIKLDRKVILPHLKSSQHDHYQEYFNEETKIIIARWFRKDIETFNYQF